MQQELRTFIFRLQETYAKYRANVLTLLFTHIVWGTMAAIAVLDDYPRLNDDLWHVTLAYLTAGINFLRYWRVFHAVNAAGRRKLRGFWIVVFVSLLVMGLCFGMGVWIGVVASFIVPMWGSKYLMSASRQKQHIRGTELTNHHRTQYEYNKLRREDDPGFLFGGAWLPSEEAVQHLAVIGASGSGKTITLKLFMQSFLPQITPYSGKRAIIHDYTRNMRPLLKGMGVTGHIHHLNVFDGRASGWLIAEDITSLSDAAELAAILAPEPSANEKSDKFFRDAAQSLLEGVTVFLQRHAPGRWTLRDLVTALSSIQLTTALLMSDPATRHYLGVLGSENTSANILSSVLVEIKHYRIIAAMTELAPNRFSLRQWLEGGHILLLGNSTQAENTLSALNRLVFTQAAKMLIEHTEVQHIPQPESFFIIDELPQLGNMDKLVNMAEVLRARGGCLALGLQSYDRLKRTYGPELASTLLGQCRHKAILRLDDAETAEWAAKLIGDQQITRMLGSYEKTPGTGRLDAWDLAAIGESVVIEPSVLASELRNIPPVSEKGRIGLTGYYLARGTWRHTYSYEELQELVLPAAKGEQGFQRVPDHLQELRPWDESDWRRLDITSLMLRLRSNDLLDETSEQFREIVEETDRIHHDDGEYQTGIRQGSSAAPPPDTYKGAGRGIDMEPTFDRPPQPRQPRQNPTFQPKLGKERNRDQSR